MLISSSSLAQKVEKNSLEKKPFSLSLSLGTNGFGGNSFLNKTYENIISTKLEMGFPITQNIGVGFLISPKFPSIKSTKYVGESKTSLVRELGAFGYYKFNLSNDFTLINKIGLSHYSLRNTIKNEYKDYHYKTKGYKIHYAPELDYNLNNIWAIFLEGNIGYINLNAKASPKLNIKYKNHLSYGMHIGLKLKY